MRLGFLTAPFPDTPLLEVADWASASGFEVLEIACWPRATGPTRRYAGTSHIDVANLSAGQVLWIPAETHWAENTGKTKVRLLVNELKEPMTATPATPATPAMPKKK